jgi:peptidoglycan/LPS O-acetylase OafA/YrhL
VIFLEVREARLIVFGVPAIMTVSAALILERSGVRRISRFIMLKVAASHAIFPFHPFILHSTFKKLSAIPLKHSSVVASIMSITAIIAVCAGGTFVHLYLEKPITNDLRGTSRVFAISPKTSEAFHNG